MPILTITGDASGAVAAARTASKAVDSLAAEAKKAERALEDMRREQERVAQAARKVQADKIREVTKAAQIAGGPIAGITSRLEPLAESIERIGLRATVTNAAMAGLASGGLALVGAAAAATSAVVLGLAVNAATVAADFDDFSESLGASSAVIERNRAAIMALSDAQGDLSITTAAARVELAALASPVMATVIDAAAGVAAGVGAMGRAFHEGSAALEIVVADTKVAAAALGVLIPPLGLLEVAAYGAAHALGALAGYGKDAADALEADRQASKAAAAAHRQYEIETTAQLDALGLLDTSIPKVTASVAAATTVTTAHATAVHATAVDYDFLTGAAQDAARAITMAQGAASAASASLPSATWHGEVSIGADEEARIQQERIQGAMQTESEIRAANAETAQVVIGNMDRIGNAALQLNGIITSAMGLAFENATDRSITARKKQFRAMKAAAIAEAAINTSLAFTRALSENAPPLNLVYGALALAAGGVQIGLIASKQFHRGGLLPDEMPGPSGSVVRQNERVAVLTRQGMDAMGGEQGLARINAGTPPAEPGPFTLVVDGVAARTRRFAQPDPGYGQRRRLAY